MASILLAALLSAAAAVCMAMPASENSGSVFAGKIDDSMLTARVKTALIADGDIRGAGINVKTRKGAVLLSGFVSSADQVERATRATLNVKGVKHVNNVIVVRQ